ncbi:MAG: IS1634 family transposase [Gammaproteobacteria bacterium]|nr:IS1634 family transposase [Gammaproteobacteria bacterium]
MSSERPETLRRKRIGEIPILQSVAQCLGFRAVLMRYLKPHGNEKIPAADTLLLLIFNIASGRQPLYELEHWSGQLDGRLFGHTSQLPAALFNDDRYARALDKLFAVDRASLMTDVVLQLIAATHLDLQEIHNDSTSIKTTGKMPGKSRSGLCFARGHSKDHRPDLKQIVFTLTLSADGAVPIHYKSYPGNRTDDTTHIDTWQVIRNLAGHPDFLYVADCKVCTDKQLSFIVRHGGRVATLLPETWTEVKTFKASLRAKQKAKQRILRRALPNAEHRYETFYRFTGRYRTNKADYALHWIYSSEKKKRDRCQRADRLNRVEQDLGALMSKLNTRQLKSEAQIIARVDKLLQNAQVSDFYHIVITPIQQRCTRQVGQGRPGKHTRYHTTVKTIYALSWTRNQQALEREQRIDGIFPILCTDEAMSAKEVLVAYKYQPRLEKRFAQLKSVHQAAPTLFKKVERVEAMMFLFFMALILQAVIEREVRQRMSENAIEAIPIYPEHRLAYHPTTAKIFDRFQETSLYQVLQGAAVVKEYRDELTPVQHSVLALLGMTEEQYWGSLTEKST